MHPKNATRDVHTNLLWVEYACHMGAKVKRCSTEGWPMQLQGVFQSCLEVGIGARLCKFFPLVEVVRNVSSLDVGHKR